MCLYLSKNLPVANSDGLIKCLPPTQDRFVASPKIYESNIFSIYKILWHPDSFISRDSIFGLAGRRAGASFFARYLDYFIVTQNSQPLPGLATVTQLHRDPKLLSYQPGLAKNKAPRHRRHLIKPPGRYSAYLAYPTDHKMNGPNALVFCSLPRLFIVTRNSQPLPGLVTF
jgi:hypothetical protein